MVLVPKTGGLVHFCVDLQKVMAVSKVDAYPMLSIDQLLDWSDTAYIYLTLDLTKGYWQILLTKIFQKKKKKPCLFHSFWVTLICYPFVWVVWSPSDISTINRENHPSRKYLSLPT